MADEPNAPATPPAGDPGVTPPAQAATTTTPPTQTPPTTTTEPPAGGANEEGLTPEQLKAELAKVRREAAAHRTKLKAFEDAQAAAEAAKLSEIEKAQRQIAQLQAAESDRTRAYQELAIRYAIATQAQALDVVDADAAMKLLDWSEIEYDENGQPKNIAKLLEKLLEAKPYLKKPTQPGLAPLPARPTPASAGGATAPGRSQAAPAGQPQQNPREWARLTEKAIWRKPGQ